MTWDRLLPDIFILSGFVAAVLVIWCVTGYLRLREILRPGDARKINHVVAFVGGSLCFGWLEPEQSRITGTAAGVVLLAAVFLTCQLKRWKPFSWAFAGNTRPDDAPNEAFYFWSSWLLSISSLLMIEVIFREITITRAAAIVVGIGDGIAEPIGSRFGRHIYKIPAIRTGKPRTRSLEGSAAVAAGAFFSIIVIMIYTTDHGLYRSLAAAGSIGMGAAIVEAVTPHGFDNLTVAFAVAGILASFGYIF